MQMKRMPERRLYNTSHIYIVRENGLDPETISEIARVERVSSLFRDRQFDSTKERRELRSRKGARQAAQVRNTRIARCIFI